MRALAARTAHRLRSFFPWLLARPMQNTAPAKGLVRFGSLRRLSPISEEWGFDRGTPVDRHYIETFLRRYAWLPGYAVGDIRGRVLELEWDQYTRQFGGLGQPDSPVERLDILHADESNPNATIVADLVNADEIPSDAFDCVICTQTLQLIYDVRAAMSTLYRVLKPGGVLLATVPGISQTVRPDIDLWGDYWRFTTRATRQLVEEFFPAEGVRVEAYGNVLTSTAFLYGIAAEELRDEELALRDPHYELLIAIRAQKK